MTRENNKNTSGMNITGTSGYDRIRGTDGRDVISGGDGNDRIRGEGGRDVIYGGADGDKLEGGKGRDMLYGEGGRDVISGGPGRDMIFGGEGNDHLFGGAGKDVLFGGAGADSLKGSFGADIFVIDLRPQALLDGPDIILDFKLGEDKVFFHSDNEGDFADFRDKEGNLEFYAFHGEDAVLASVMLNVTRDDFFASDSLTFVEIV